MLAIEWGTGIEDAWSNVAEFLPKLLAFGAILLIGTFVVKAISKIADSALERVGFDRAVERGGVGKALSKSKYDASSLVSRVVYYALLLIVLQMAFGVFGQNPVSDLIEGVIAYLPKVIAAIIIVVVATAIAAAVKEIVESALGGLDYGRGLAIGASTAIIVIGAFAALDQLQIAQNIVTGLFYAMLAIVAGSAIIAIGGGGIMPMRQRWEAMLQKYDEEKPKIRQESQGAKQRVQERAEVRMDQARSASGSGGARTGRTPRRAAGR